MLRLLRHMKTFFLFFKGMQHFMKAQILRFIRQADFKIPVGLVFQIVDDILDVTSTTEELGKPVGSDADNDKTTFITLYGLQGAHEKAEHHNAAALAALDALGPRADFLRLMAAELLERKK